MQSWLAHKLISYVMGRTRAGDIRPTLLLDAPDVQLTFPGRNSWSGVYRGKQEVERWLRAAGGGGPADLPRRGRGQGDAVEHDDLHPRPRPSRRSRRHPGVREPVRDLGPAVVGPAEGVRGLRGHASPARRSTLTWPSSVRSWPPPEQTRARRRAPPAAGCAGRGEPPSVGSRLDGGRDHHGVGHACACRASSMRSRCPRSRRTGRCWCPAGEFAGAEVLHVSRHGAGTSGSPTRSPTAPTYGR